MFSIFLLHLCVALGIILTDRMKEVKQAEEKKEMEKEVQERFERIERTLDRVGERLDRMTERQEQLSEGHIDLEAAQKNMTVAVTRFIDATRARFDEVGEKIS